MTVPRSVPKHAKETASARDTIHTAGVRSLGKAKGPADAGPFGVRQR